MHRVENNFQSNIYREKESKGSDNNVSWLHVICFTSSFVALKVGGVISNYFSKISSSFFIHMVYFSAVNMCKM